MSRIMPVFTGRPIKRSVIIDIVKNYVLRMLQLASAQNRRQEPTYSTRIGAYLKYRLNCVPEWNGTEQSERTVRYGRNAGKRSLIYR